MFIRKILTAYLAALLVSSAVFTAYAQESKIINTQKTNVHKNVFDIPLYMVPVPGLNLTKTPGGAADKNKRISFEASRIRVAYLTLLEEFNEDNLKKAGMELKSHSEFLWNGSNAMLLKVFQKNKTNIMGKWILIIDRGEETWMINGLYEAKDQKRGEAVLDMLKSICWTEEKSEANLPIPFIDTEKGKDTATPFRIAGLVQEALVYTKDGNLPTKSEDGALFVVSRDSDAYIVPGQQSGFAKKRFKQIEPDKRVEIFSEKEVLINGLSGIELVAYAEDDPKYLLYQTLLFDDKGNQVFVGISHGNALDNLGFFRTLTKECRDFR